MSNRALSLKQRAAREVALTKRKANSRAEEPIDITCYRNERSVMGFPLFSTKYARGRERGTAPVEYQFETLTGKRFFRVTPQPDFGMPDQVDANIIRYAISKAREIRYQVGTLPDYVEVTRYELCKQLGLGTSGKQYQELNKRLNRLAGAHFEGNIFQQKEVFTGTLVSFAYPEKCNGHSAVQIIFNPKFKIYLEEDTACLAIPDEVLKLKSPLKIRLIEFLRLRMGDKDEWTIGLSKLAAYCGVPEERSLRLFKRDLQRIELPYKILFSSDSKTINQKVTFRR